MNEPQLPPDEVRFCPGCGGARVDFSSLVGGEATCKGCGWKGSREELLVVPIKHDYMGKDHLLLAMMSDIRSMLSGELGVPYLKFLLKWGFLEADVRNLKDTLDNKKFSRYLAVIAHAVLKAVIEAKENEVPNGATVQ